MKKIITIIFLGLILISGFIIGSPGLPHIFNGKISYGLFESHDIPEGTEITATIGGDKLGVIGYVDSENQYGPIQVIPNGVTGAIRFYVGGIATEESIQYVAGQVNGGDEEDFDLTLEEWTEDWSYCGDGVIDDGEQCDNESIGFIFDDVPATCDNLWYANFQVSGYTGNVLCTDECKWDYISNCTAPVQETPNTDNGGNSGGGGGSSSGGGGGGGSSSSTTSSATTSSGSDSSSSEEIMQTSSPLVPEETTSEDKGNFFGITGRAISNIAKSKAGKGVFILVLLAIAGGAFFMQSNKKKENGKKTKTKKSSGKTKSIKIVKMSELAKRKK